MWRLLTDIMVSHVVSNVMTRSGRPNDYYFLPDVFLRSRMFEGMDDLAPEFFLKNRKNQHCAQKEETIGKIKATCLGNFGAVDNPPPSPVARTRWTGRRTRFISVPFGSVRVKLTIQVPEESFSADVTVEAVQTLSSMILA